MPVIKAQIGLHDCLRVHSYFFWCKKKWWKDDEDRCNSAKVLLNTQTGWIQLSGSKSKIFKNEAWFCDCQPQIFNLLVKILESDSETKIFLYIGKWINGKFSISGGFEDIFVNKVESGQFAYLVKLWRCCTYPHNLFTISFCIKKSKNERLTSHVDQSAP